MFYIFSIFSMRKLHACVGVEHFEGLFGIDNTRDYHIECHKSPCIETVQTVKERAAQIQQESRN